MTQKEKSLRAQSLPAGPRLAQPLLTWYDRHRRVLPWRALPGETAEAYKVWLSEIMLQQTTVQAVIPYYERFIQNFPHITELAHAPQERVLQLWAGLGYYARARNLHACAKIIDSSYGGIFPETVESLLKLPGIGAYTARAVAAIAFNVPVVPVDGNVERVTARLFGITTPLPAARSELARQAAQLNKEQEAQQRPSDFAQALFDLGATICTSRNPSCLTCPLRPACKAHQQGMAHLLPARSPKKPRPVRYGVVFHLIDGNGNVLLRRRPQSGLLGGMDDLPGTEWRETPWTEEEAMQNAPRSLAPSQSMLPNSACHFPPVTRLNWEHIGEINHIFTHFSLYLKVYRAYFRGNHDRPVQWTSGVFRPTQDAAFPGVIRKCLAIKSPSQGVD